MGAAVIGDLSATAGSQTMVSYTVAVGLIVAFFLLFGRKVEEPGEPQDER